MPSAAQRKASHTVASAESQAPDPYSIVPRSIKVLARRAQTDALLDRNQRTSPIESGLDTVVTPPLSVGTPDCDSPEHFCNTPDERRSFVPLAALNSNRSKTIFVFQAPPSNFVSLCGSVSVASEKVAESPVMLGNRLGDCCCTLTDLCPDWADGMICEKPSNSFGSDACPVITEAEHASATANAKRLRSRCGDFWVVIVHFH
jgi:hypothetical protein